MFELYLVIKYNITKYIIFFNKTSIKPNLKN
jgi:hypothetical protein